MLTLPLTTVRRILCLGAHADDIEIGCGGTLLRLFQARQDLSVCWVVFSAAGRRADEARASAERYLQDIPSRQIVIADFQDGFFPYHGAAIKDHFEQLKTQPPPDLVLTHFRRDLHQDHRLIGQLAWNTFRDQLILEYEVPKYDGDLGAPNLFVPLSTDTVDLKLEYLHSFFPSQHKKHWFHADTFRSLMRLRGMECRAPSNFAEAFYARKLRLGIG